MFCIGRALENVADRSRDEQARFRTLIFLIGEAENINHGYTPMKSCADHIADFFLPSCSTAPGQKDSVTHISLQDLFRYILNTFDSRTHCLARSCVTFGIQSATRVQMGSTGVCDNPELHFICLKVGCSCIISQAMPGS